MSDGCRGSGGRREGRGDSRRPVRPPARRGGIYAPGNKGRIVPGGVRTGLSVRGRGGRWGLSEGNFGGEVDGVAGAGATGLISGLGHTNARCGG